jgi:transposase-like protein
VASTWTRCPGTGTAAFEPGIVRKRQRRLDGVDQIICAFGTQGLPTGEITAHFGDVYGATVSKETHVGADEPVDEFVDGAGLRHAALPS